MRSKISAREEGQKWYQFKNPCRQSGFIESPRRKEASFKLTAKSGNRSAYGKSKWKRVSDSSKRLQKERDLFWKVRFDMLGIISRCLSDGKQVIKSKINWWSVNKVRTKWILSKEEGRGKWCILKEWIGAPERKEERTFLIRHELKVPDILHKALCLKQQPTSNFS